MIILFTARYIFTISVSRVCLRIALQPRLVYHHNHHHSKLDKAPLTGAQRRRTDIKYIKPKR